MKFFFKNIVTLFCGATPKNKIAKVYYKVVVVVVVRSFFVMPSQDLSIFLKASKKLKKN